MARSAAPNVVTAWPATSPVPLSNRATWFTLVPIRCTSYPALSLVHRALTSGGPIRTRSCGTDTRRTDARGDTAASSSAVNTTVTLFATVHGGGELPTQCTGPHTLTFTVVQVGGVGVRDRNRVPVVPRARWTTASCP